MKKLLLILGIASFVVCAFSLFVAIVSLHGYYNVSDGSAELYRTLYQRMSMGFAGGGLFAVIGTICMILRNRM